MTEENWEQHALCKEEGDITLFFAYPSDVANIKAAKQICARCPVRYECLEDALSWPITMDFGIRGGKTEEERSEMPRVRSGASHPGHDTLAGYMYERKHLGVTCPSCREAMARWKAGRRAERRPRSQT